MRRHGSRRAVLTIGLVVCAIALAGCGSGAKQTQGVGQLIEVSAPPSPTPTVIETPSPTPDPTTPAPTSTPTLAPPTQPAAKPLTCPHTDGKPQSPAKVLAELTAASKVNEYAAAKVDPATLDSSLNGKLPVVHIPLTMLKAIAAQESAWTSTCISTDGTGYGVMQMQDNATADTNMHFQTTFNRMDQSQNVMLGTAWLEYLTVHIGILYFHNNFNLSTNYPLRDAVLAAYNVGLGNVVYPDGIHIGPLGTQYFQTVVALMQKSQPCQKSWGRQS